MLAYNTPVRQHQVGGKSWQSVRKAWWDNFASLCVFAWRSALFSGADLGRLRNHNTALGTAHNELQWAKLLWTHLWMDHILFCKEVENVVKVLLLYHGGKSPEAEAHVAPKGGPQPPPGETRGASGFGQPHH